MALRANFELGIPGAKVSAGGVGDSDAWTSVSSVLGDALRAYDTTQAAVGGQSCKMLTVTSTGTSMTWGPSADLGTLANHYGRLYLYLTANPGASVILVRCLNGVSAACAVGVTSGGKVFVSDQAAVTKATGSVSVALNQWVRLEWHVTHDVTNGVVEAKLFNTAASATADETITGAGSFSTLASADTIRFGVVNSVANAGPLWMDAIVAAAGSYPGAEHYPVIYTTDGGAMAIEGLVGDGDTVVRNIPVLIGGVDGSGKAQTLKVGTDGSITTGSGGTLPAALGQTTMTASLPVTLASDQSELPVSLDTPVQSAQSGAWSVTATSPGDTPTLLNAITAKTSVRGTAGVMTGVVSLYNPNAVDIWLQVFDVATTGGVTLGSTAPKFSIWLPPLSAYDNAFPRSVTFAAGIIVAPTTTPTGAVAATTGVTGSVLHAAS